MRRSEPRPRRWSCSASPKGHRGHDQNTSIHIRENAVSRGFTWTRRFIYESPGFPWVHLGIGLVGGLTFFVGSIFFLWEGALQLAGVWLFIIGSFGMVLGSLGQTLVKIETQLRGQQPS